MMWWIQGEVSLVYGVLKQIVQDMKHSGCLNFQVGIQGK